MYKKLLAVSAFCLPVNDVHARSSVTFAGIIDSGLSYKTGANATNASQGRCRCTADMSPRLYNSPEPLPCDPAPSVRQ